MIILGTDTSAAVAGAAVYDTEKRRFIAGGYLNCGFTHSQTVLPLIEDMLKNAGTELKDIDVFAVSAGPGSFTGLRIGVSAVKGMAYALGKPCRAVSTLMGMAYSLTVYEGIVCAVMDARCGQVYNALFKISGGIPERLCPDRALAITELEAELNEKYTGGRILLCGDGARLCADKMNVSGLECAPPNICFQSGEGVCLAACECEDVSAAALMPGYLRLPQAERERNARLAAEKAVT